jgi:hypothetical protein
MRRKFLTFLIASTALTPIALNAEQNFFKDKLPSIVKNIAQGFEDGNEEEAAQNEITDYSLNAANSALDSVEENVVANTPFTHLELSLGSDAFGLDKSGTQTKTEAIGVLRLHETENTFLFNQTSIVGFDDRTTMNIGFGARNINDDETVIIGANVFYDYELDSKHARTGFGVELLTSLIEMRANKYNASTGTKTYKGIQETALDGHDIKISGNLPYFYSSNVYFKQSEFKDNASYKITNDEWGIEAEIAPNLTIGLAEQKGTGRSAQTVASINYTIALGAKQPTVKAKQDGKWSTSLKPIREKLYKPVQRENRIMKKAIKLGVTVSGY